ncbi:hypothetical protein KAW64_00160 [bacterium]|nr:hypothetical protein [bacterium]
MTTARSIDYWGIVTRSAGIAWNHRFLWFFGFFASAGGGGDFGSWGERGFDEVRDFLTSHIGLFVVIIMGLVFLWLVLVVLSFISKGALLSCISRVDAGERVRFEEGWRAGTKAFWGVLGITVIAAVVFLVVTAVCGFAVVLPLMGGAAGIAIGIFIGAILAIPYILFLLLLTFTVVYAEREYVIRGGGVTDALSAGWELTRTYFRQSLVMWLVTVASSMAFVIGLLIVLVAMAMPFILIGIANPIAGLILGIPVGLVVLVLTISAYSTYEHSLWTLMYRNLTGLSGDVSVVATEPPAPETPADRWDMAEGRSDEEL